MKETLLYFAIITNMKKWIIVLLLILIIFLPSYNLENEETQKIAITSTHSLPSGHFIIQWEKSYGKLPFWSARYEGPQPVGDADNDGKNELLIGGRDPFLRVMKWNGNGYYEEARIKDACFKAGYTFFGLPEPFGSATGFAIGDIDNDGKNEIGVAWGRHFSAFKWDGSKFVLMGRYIIVKKHEWGTTLDCIIGDVDNDGRNEVVVTGGYQNEPEVIVLQWDGSKFVKKMSWDYPGNYWVYFPWIGDADNDGKNELIVNTNATIVLKWNGNEWEQSMVAYHNDSYPFACIAKDSDNDGKNEIHVTFYAPMLKIYEYENGSYMEKESFYWEGEEGTIEAIDVGDVDNDNMQEIAVGTNVIHILKWNGHSYEEAYVINATHGLLAVTCIGDFDNDGKDEINAGNVGVDTLGEEYESWIFKYVD